ncbi:MAG: PhoH family protein [Mameliella sp.]|nr:PhoH family protein [Mameliella sp.]
MASRRRREAKVAREIHNEQKARQDPPLPKPPKAPPLEPMTAAQAAYITSIEHERITFGLGPAGVGKTYCAGRVAARMLKNRDVEKIVLSRPAVEAGQPMGFLPGDVDEKMAPYMAAYGPAFIDELGQGSFEYYTQYNVIEVVPLSFMQGRSWDRPSIVLLDEAQNSTPFEMKMFLTRIGKAARLVIDGDPRQKAINGQSGLIDGLKRTRYIPGVGVAEFTHDDIVRDDIVREILLAYEDEGSTEIAHDRLPGFITGDANTD